MYSRFSADKMIQCSVSVVTQRICSNPFAFPGNHDKKMLTTKSGELNRNAKVCDVPDARNGKTTQEGKDVGGSTSGRKTVMSTKKN